MQITLYIIGAVIIVIFAVPIFERVFNLGTAVGIFAGCCYILGGFMIQRVSDLTSRKIYYILIALLIAVIFLLFMIYRKGKTKPCKADVIVVLGCRVNGDIPSRSLEKRVDAAFSYLMEHPSCVAILSGGRGKDENISEALCMKNMLTWRGINQSRLILEDKSTSTDENIRFSLEYIKKLDLGNEIAVATSEYHQLRAKRICEKYSLKASAVSSPTKLTQLPTMLLRELIALTATFLNK
ncbi:MAG: YdcF family protein [Clostridiales bacterium]|nr:YdcF family protein [Clostridiales bacterium]